MVVSALYPRHETFKQVYGLQDAGLANRGREEKPERVSQSAFTP